MTVTLSNMWLQFRFRIPGECSLSLHASLT
jgi:hypothetical protein